MTYLGRMESRTDYKSTKMRQQIQKKMLVLLRSSSAYGLLRDFERLQLVE